MTPSEIREANTARDGWMLSRELHEKLFDTRFDPSVDRYFEDMRAAWKIVEYMTARMGYDNLGFSWEGPLFKAEHRYLTNEGYPLGTTCWYVVAEAVGLRKFVCAETAPLAICHAALWIVEQEAQP